jgi:aspartate racemase
LGKGLINAGAECLVLGANTFHNYAEALTKNLKIPIIHIVEETALSIKDMKLNKVGLLGTKFTMEGEFYHSIMAKHGIELILPEVQERELIHNSIYNEFGKGIFREEVKVAHLKIIDKLYKKGAQAIIMGCTEIPILLEGIELQIPLLDTASIHVEAIVKYSLEN